MTALNFPSNPDTGQVYSAPNGTIYIFDGTKWDVQGTTVTSEASINFVQDSVATLFTNMSGDGISFSYDDQTNTMSATLTATGSGLSVSDFGDGFSLDNNKIVTRKLYSTNPNNSSTHYRLELTTGGTIKLPDQSEIIGSTLKGIAGTGELNYTGITIGPSSGNSENTWMYVDAYDAYIATDYNNTQKTWKFDKDGILNLPNNNGQIGQLAAPYTGLEFRTGSGADWIGISYGEINDNNTSYFYFDKDGSNYTTANHRAHLQIKNPAHNGHVEWLFDSTGVLTFPNGALKIAGNTISNLTGVGSGLVSGSQLEVALAKTVITHGVTTTLGDPGSPSLTSQYLVEVGTDGILNALQIINTLGDGDGGLTSELLTELDQTGFKIGLRVTNDLGSGEPLTSFNGWTFGNVGQQQAITFPDDTVQTTAWAGSIDYANIVNIPIPPEIDIDGGHALASFTLSANADGGGSSQRFGPNSTVFNGGGAIGSYTNTLDGGGA